MSDAVEPTPSVTGLERFTAELGDALERHARTLPAPQRMPRAARAARGRRRVAVAAVAAAAAAIALAVGLDGQRAGSPEAASAASVLRASADALPRDAAGPLAAGGYWHTVVDVAMRRADPGPDGFEYVTTQRWETWRSRDGSGRERLTARGPVELVGPADRRAWAAAGSPALAEPDADRRLPATDRPFAFGPRALTYARLERLPAEPRALAEVLARMVARRRSAIPATFDAGQARAYLLFTLIRDAFEAPTSPALRAALYDVMATAPGLRLAGAATDHAGRSGTAVAVVLGDARFVLVVDPRSGALLETRRVLLRSGSQFPGMAPGPISRATFLRSDVVRRVAR